MSNDLVERLYDRRVCSPAQNSCRNDWVLDQAAAHIEELEAELKYWRKDSADAWDKCEENRLKLAKAVEALGGMVGLFSGYSLLLKGMHLNMELDNARAALADLSKERSDEKGQDDE